MTDEATPTYTPREVLLLLKRGLSLGNVDAAIAMIDQLLPQYPEKLFAADEAAHTDLLAQLENTKQRLSLCQTVSSKHLGLLDEKQAELDALASHYGRVLVERDEALKGVAQLAEAKSDIVAVRQLWREALDDAHDWNEAQRSLAAQLAEAKQELASVTASFDAQEERNRYACACMHDRPTDVCLTHSPMVVKLQAQLAAKDAELAELKATTSRDQWKCIMRSWQVRRKPKL